MEDEIYRYAEYPHEQDVRGHPAVLLRSSSGDAASSSFAVAREGREVVVLQVAVHPAGVVGGGGVLGWGGGGGGLRRGLRLRSCGEGKVSLECEQSFLKYI